MCVQWPRRVQLQRLPPQQLQGGDAHILHGGGRGGRWRRGGLWWRWGRLGRVRSCWSRVWAPEPVFGITCRFPLFPQFLFEAPYCDPAVRIPINLQLSLLSSVAYEQISSSDRLLLQGYWRNSCYTGTFSTVRRGWVFLPFCCDSLS